MKKLLFLVILYVCNMALGLAAEDRAKVVRVGWYESAFCHTDSSGHRTGYAYEYQQRVAANTGWEYEYVDAPWPELLDMLKRGEIDLLTDVSYTEDRKDQILFSQQSMGVEDCYLFSLASNPEIQIGIMSTQNNKTIGMNKSSLMLGLVQKWQKQYNLNVTIREYSLNQEAYISMLRKGELDAVAYVSSFMDLASADCLPVAYLGSSSIYFGINKNRPDLKEELDRAMARIKLHNPYYDRDLHEKYFAKSAVYQYMPHGDKVWLQNHGTLRIGYRDNYLPFSGTDPITGKVKGLLKDFIDLVSSSFRNVDVKIEAIAYPTINAAIDACKRGEVDLAFPCGLSTYDANEEGLIATDAFVKSPELAVMRADDNFHANRPMRVAINARNPNYLSLLREKYPHWQIVGYPSTLECLQGVKRGEADLLLISSYRLNVLNQEIEKLGLKAVATGSVIQLNFATRKGNSQLFSVIDRLVHMMSNTEIYNSLANNSEVLRRITVRDFILQHVALFFVVLFVILGIFIYLFLRSRREHILAVNASQAKSRFLFSMSHDIRTPMNAIIGYTNLMERSLDEKEKCKDYLEKMRRSSNFLLNLINNVLEMARIESGRLELTEKAVLQKNLLMDVKEIYYDLMKKKNINLILENHTYTPAIYCDPVKLDEIYMNLLSNAYKYTPNGGTVSIIASEFPCNKPGYTTIQIIIRDTGIGMSKEYLPHVFEDFTRERSYTDSKIKGSGLGMSIVRKLVVMMGGTIEVDSNLGKGTTFTVTIPHRIADEKKFHQGQQEGEAEAPDFNGHRILLAEDNDLNAEIAIELLSEFGFEIERAENGQACVEMLQKAVDDYYDIILMDIQMPLMNGYEAAREIRSMRNSRKANIPIVAMTANAFKKDVDDALAAGMNDHVGKPIDMQILLRVLAQQLRKK